MFSSKKPQPFQGWPQTKIDKEKVTVHADYRSPDKIKKGEFFSGLGALAGIGIFFAGMGDGGPLGAAIVGGIIGFILHNHGESLKEKVTIEFTEDLIRFNTGGWEWKEFNRKVPHPFKMEEHVKGQEEAAKEAHERKGLQKRIYRDSYHIYMDHLNGAFYLPDIYEKQKANMFLNRLQGVDEYMKTFRAEDRSSDMAQDPYKERPGLSGLGKQKRNIKGKPNSNFSPLEYLKPQATITFFALLFIGAPTCYILFGYLFKNLHKLRDFFYSNLGAALLFILGSSFVFWVAWVFRNSFKMPEELTDAPPSSNDVGNDISDEKGKNNDNAPKNEEKKKSSPQPINKKEDETQKKWKKTLGGSRLAGLKSENDSSIGQGDEKEEDDPEYKNYHGKDTYNPNVSKRLTGDPWEELDSMIGLKAVKEQVLKLMALIETNQKRLEEGLTVKAMNFHMVFTGNPGTGKTTVARILSDIFNNLGITTKRGFIETDRSKIVGSYRGETENKLNDILKKAKGRVLFIDEAYALNTEHGPSGDANGRIIIDRLTKALEDNREDFIAIFAGYEKEMEEFLKVNPGLESRIPIKIQFPDYSEDELFEIFEVLCQKENYVLDSEGKDKLKMVLNKIYIARDDKFANGRAIRNVFEECIANHAVRLAEKEDASKQELMTIKSDDIPTSSELFPDASKDGENDPWVKLNQMIGLEDVKSQVKNIVGVISNQERRKEMGLPVNTRSYHMVFTGNPGTGKTTVARIMSELLFNLGVSKKRGVIELDRAQIVGQWRGHTENNLNEILKKVQGRILFIDEAYALYTQEHSLGDSDGKKIVDRLNKALEDDRDKFIAIFAGYEKEMTEFLKVNPGLESRFPLKVHFPDYTPEELVQIFENLCREGQYVLEPEAQKKIKNFMANLYDNRRQGFGNGRTVRNIFEKVQEKQSVRTSKIENIAREQLIEIKEEDIPDNL